MSLWHHKLICYNLSHMGQKQHLNPNNLLKLNHDTQIWELIYYSYVKKTRNQNKIKVSLHFVKINK